MAPRPSSPSSLLWAHQLKREHNYLLKRTKNLESTSQQHGDRIASAESTARCNSAHDVETLAAQVKAMEDSGVEKRVTDVEATVTRKLEDVEADSEAMTLQIAALRKDDVAAEEERKKTVAKEKALLKRINEVEEGLKKYEQSLDRIGRRVNEDQFKQIRDQLEDLSKQVQKEGSQMKMLEESVRVLEVANGELIKANEKLEADLKKIAERSAAAVEAKAAESKAAPKPIVSAVVPEQDATSGAERQRPKKKSHKWVGGGADRDIIRTGSDTFGAGVAVPKSPSPEASVVKKRPPPPLKPGKKPVPPKKGVSSHADDEGTSKKSHRWAGGGADKDIISAGVVHETGSRRKLSHSVGDILVAPTKRRQILTHEEADEDTIRARPTPDVKPRPQKTTTEAWAKDGVKEKDVLRAGKGWYEVAASPSQSQQAEASSAPVKRPRGRPRKNPAPQWNVETLTQPRTTRHGTQLPNDDQHVSRKRKAGAGSDSPDSSKSPERPFKKQKIVIEDNEADVERTHPAPTIFSSPMASNVSRNLDDQTTASRDTNDVPPVVVKNEPDEAAPKPPRRQILQPDDMSTIMRYLSG